MKGKSLAFSDTTIGGQRPLPPKLDAQSNLPLSKNGDFDRFLFVVVRRFLT